MIKMEPIDLAGHHNCPYCGEVIDSDMLVCKACKSKISKKANLEIKALYEQMKLEQLKRRNAMKRLEL